MNRTGHANIVSRSNLIDASSHNPRRQKNYSSCEQVSSSMLVIPANFSSNVFNIIQNKNIYNVNQPLMHQLSWRGVCSTVNTRQLLQRGYPKQNSINNSNETSIKNPNHHHQIDNNKGDAATAIFAYNTANISNGSLRAHRCNNNIIMSIHRHMISAIPVAFSIIPTIQAQPILLMRIKKTTTMSVIQVIHRLVYAMMINDDFKTKMHQIYIIIGLVMNGPNL